MSEPNKYFLGWDQPFLSTSAKWLLDHCLQEEFGSSDQVLILVSGQAIGNRLQSMFINEAHKRGRAVELPWIGTPSQLFRKFIGTRGRFADQATMLLVTTAVLREMESNIIAPIVGPRRPSPDDVVAWSVIARQVCEAIKTATGSGHSLDRSTWPAHATEMLTDSAIKRFDVLREIHAKVETILSKDGLCIFEYEQLALLNGDRSLDLGSTQRVVVVGASDLAVIATQLLDRLVDQGVLIDVLIRAPESASLGFDTHGCIENSFWINAEIEIEDSSISVSGSPSAQAAEVVRTLAGLDENVTTDQITISSTDEQLIPTIQRHVQGHGVQTRFAGGNPVLQRQEALLLSSVTAFVSTRTFESYASLVRHPDIVDLLTIDSSAVKSLSNYSMNVVPNQISTKHWFNPKESRDDYSELRSLHKKVVDLLTPCFTLERKPALIDQSLPAIRAFLLAVYGDDVLDREDPKLQTLQKIFGVIDRLDAVSETICMQLGPLRVSEVLQILLSELNGVSIPAPHNLGAIDTVGWLEAIAIDTPHVIVVGMSADIVGGNDPSDAYFPDGLRKALGLETINRRMARDAHAIVAMQKSRSHSGSTTWIVGRKNTAGDPLTPSPLLMRCSDGDQLAKRSGSLVVSMEKENPEIPPQFKHRTVGKGIPFPNPKDIKHERMTRVSVTAFKDYLACPYRFWLKHVMKLNLAEEGSSELDAKLFGSFVHAVLQRFGEDESVRNSSDAAVIEQSLNRELDRLVAEQLGTTVSGKVNVQVELARFRLKGFAEHQARSISDGWKIVCIERKVKTELRVEGTHLIISGVIDRIDVHEDGRIRVLDYKTGATSANEAHYKKNDAHWIDFQLPLYRCLLPKIEELDEYDTGNENVSLGYFKIGDQESTSGIDLLDLPLDVMEAVQDHINMTVESILRGEFNEGPTEPAPTYSDTYGWICQDDSITAEALDD